MFDIDKVYGFFYDIKEEYVEITRRKELIESIKENINNISDESVQNRFQELITQINSFNENYSARFDNLDSLTYMMENVDLKGEITNEKLTNYFKSLSKDQIIEINKLRFTKGNNSLRVKYSEDFELASLVKTIIQAYNQGYKDEYNIDDLIDEISEIKGVGKEIKNAIKELKTLTEKHLFVTESSQNSKRASDNLKLDYIRAVLESKSSTKSFLSPGNFDTIKANNKVINKAKASQRNLKEVNGDYVEDLNAGSVNTWVQIASQMNTGKSLIGVSANANAAHSIFQHADKLELENPFLFDGIEYNDLTERNVITNKDRLITKVIAETLAAFVDNGKDPQAKYSNINGFTIDIAMAMALVGIDLDTIQFFLSQDEIEMFVNDYFNNGQDLEKTKQQYGISNASLKNMKPSDFSTKDLKNNLSKDLKLKRLIETMLIYKDYARPISNLVTAVKVGEAGLGPSDSHNLSRLDILSSENFKGIDGATELLERDDLFNNRLSEVIRDGRLLIVNKTKLPNRDLGAFHVLRNMFNVLKSNGNLSVNQIEFVNKNYLDYLSSGYFKFDKQLIATLPEQLTKLKQSSSKYKLLLERLMLDTDTDNNITYITYSGISGQDKLLMDQIRDDWESMLTDGTAEERQFAKDLVKYTFMISGFRITPQSFSHLAPIKFYSSVEREFIDYMNKKIRSAEETYSGFDYINHFFNQFIQNHFRSLSYVPVADIEVNVEKSTSNNDVLETITLKEDIFRDSNGDFLPYVKLVENNKLKLFKLNNVVTGKNERHLYATYEAYSPLGTYKRKGQAKGKMFTYYEFGSKVNPIFKQNKIQNIEVKPKLISQTSNRKTYSGMINDLGKDQVFVFGSNPEGRHGKGAAKVAKDKFGAKYGKGRGLQGRSYALPTKNLKAGFVEKSTGIKYSTSGEKSLSPEQIMDNISELYTVAKQNPTKEFLVAYTVSKNLNGYDSREMAFMFYNAGTIPKNIVFNDNFEKLITLAELEDQGDASTTC